MSNILICSGSTGGGHHQVAQTLKRELESQGHQVEVTDILTEYSKVVKFFAVDGYRFLYKHFGRVYGSLYRATNSKLSSKRSSKIFSKLLRDKFLEKVKEFDPDLIITVHPFGSGILGPLREQGKLDCKVIALITDFTAHWTHIGKGIDRYIVASDFLKKNLIKKGVDPEIIKSAGIPIRKEFEEKNMAEREDGIFHVLIMGGSDGENFISNSLFWIALNPDIHVTIVCGNNETLKRKLEKRYHKRNQIVVKGYVKEIKPLMSRADLIVTKPGAITVTEAISQELPIIIPYAIPGHETNNAKFLVELGVAQRAHTSLFLAYSVEKMLNDPKIMETMRDSIKLESVKHSTNDIIETISECIS